MIESKQPKIPKHTKVCIHCNKEKELTEFNTNKQFAQQGFRDAWCKQCLSACMTKEDIREYFWENNRQWKDQIWDKARQKAKELAEQNPIYNKSSQDRQRQLLQRLTAQQIPNIMQYYYVFVDNDKSMTYEEAKEKGVVPEAVDEEEKKFSSDFNGWFKKTDTQYLENYYNKLEQDFDLNNETLRDHARKVAKASLQLDKSMDDYSAGRCDYSVVKDAMAVFDTLNKSANFAECKRKPGENSGLTCWAETTLKLLKDGKIISKPVKWPDDDVDKVVNLYKHTLEAVGYDQL